MTSDLYFIENLTLRAWLWPIWPVFVAGLLKRRTMMSPCYVIDSSAPIFLFAKFLGAVIGIRVQKLKFRLIDVRDENDLLVRLRIEYGDIFEVQKNVTEDPAFQQIINGPAHTGRLGMFLAKTLGCGSRFERNTLWKVMFLAQVCVWKAKQESRQDSPPVIFLAHRPWFNAIQKYVENYGLTVVGVPASLDLLKTAIRSIPSPVKDILRAVKYRRFRVPSYRPSKSAREETAVAIGGQIPKIVTEYAGQLNLDHPELHSDFAFWQESDLNAKHVMAAFSGIRDPLDQDKWAQLERHGMGALILNQGATTVPGSPVFKWSRRTPVTLPALNIPGAEGRWLKKWSNDYYTLHAYWTEVFKTYNVKVYVSFLRQDPTHFVIADALRSLGGVMVMYQRSCEWLPAVQTTTCADVVFAFSQELREVERLSNSEIPYHVTTGYLGDHRYRYLRPKSGKIREKLLRNGATKVLAYFDENSADDERLHTGHSYMRENYSFLLEKVLSEPWLGLLFKPKNPRTLRARLGPISEILKLAEETGRCYVFEEGIIQGAHPPAEAALESDLAIHGHLAGATAGFEAVLSGTPTLLLDREGWGVSPLYRLPAGTVVFTNWDTLWKACSQHFAAPAGTPGFGDWSVMLAEMDPFRDGRASERMGNFLQCLITGMEQGLDRDAALAEAAEGYRNRWGADKIGSVSGALRLGAIGAGVDIDPEA